MTKEERLEYQRKRRAANNNADTRKYEKTHKGFLMRLYRNMKSRVEGVQKKKFYLYENKPILSKEEFYSWAEGSPDFYKLFEEYESSGWDRKLAPSVDRIDSRRGYDIDNMEWVTMLENSIRGNKARWGNK